NQLLRQTESAALFRVLYACEEDDESWVIETKLPLSLPEFTTFGQLRTEYEVYTEMPPVNVSAQSLLRPATTLQPLSRRALSSSISVSDRAWAAIEPLVQNRRDTRLFVPALRGQILHERAAVPGMPSEKTLLKYLRWFWQRGLTQDAVLGHYELCGRPNVKGTANRGYHAKGMTNYQCTEDDYTAMRAVVTDFYFDPDNPPSIPQTHQHLLEEHYAYWDGNGDRYLKPRNETPSKRQLKYFIDTTWTKEEISRARKGDKHVDANERPTPNSAQDICHGIGHIYQIDASVLDLPAISTNHPEIVVGKCTMYLVMDHRSRKAVGWYVGFENASLIPATQAILSIGEDKAALCKRLNLPYDPEDWRAHGILPEEFMADQGDLASKEARRICRSIAAGIRNCPGLRPDLKGFVENGFHLVHVIIKPGTEAFAPNAEVRKRRQVDHEKDAAYDRTDIERIFVAAIIAYNKMPQDFPLTDDMVVKGTLPTPNEVWKYEERFRVGALDRMDFEKVRAELMPVQSATLTGDGIRVRLSGPDGKQRQGFDIFYCCPEALEQDWLFAARKHVIQVEVAFEFHCVNEIIVFSPNGRSSHVAKLTGDSERFENMSRAEVYLCYHDRAALVEVARQEGKQALNMFHQRRDETSAVAVPRRNAAVAAAGRHSGAARKRNGKAERAVELCQERRDRPAKGRVAAGALSEAFHCTANVYPGPETTGPSTVDPSAQTEPSPTRSAFGVAPMGLKARLLQDRARTRSDQP
ncbi:MAG: hypothetical protein JSS56_24555, partial [Proteobacteria bacterium]|nr:hypothetical protein [Pseudomonadota bacterium]